MPKLPPPSPTRQERHMQREKEVLTCEHPACDNTHELWRAHSFIVVLVHISPAGLRAVQCDALQHFQCSHACAVEMVKTCMAEHPHVLPDPRPFTMAPGFAHPLAGRACAICQAPLDQEGYRFSACYAMPGVDADGRSYPAYMCTDEHWCCSEEHAREAAEACIDEHLSGGEYKRPPLLLEAPVHLGIHDDAQAPLDDEEESEGS